jgi:hypothetical protein
VADGPYRTQAQVEDTEVSRDCPKCGLTNPPRAQRCDCGWDFDKAAVAPSYLAERKRRLESTPTPMSRLIAGALLVAAGAGLSIASCGSGSAGGGILFYGLIFVGIVTVFRGLAQR